VYDLKRGCSVCHQMGNKATREIEPSLGTSIRPPWPGSGGSCPARTARMTDALNNSGTTAAWRCSRIGATGLPQGEVPPAPPRPQGVERNVVVTLWEVDTDKSFIHDVDQHQRLESPANAYGPVYAPTFAVGEIWALNPKDNTKTMVQVPLRNEATESSCRRLRCRRTVSAPSPYWGNEMIWNDPNFIGMPHMDSKGRIWFHAQTRPDLPDYCKKGIRESLCGEFSDAGRLGSQGHG
jgi:hypothetical protein